MADRRKLREQTVQLPQFDRVATVRSESFDVEANTVEIVWTTGASVRRYDWWDGTEYDEVLSVDPKSVRLERLNLGAPFLDSHCSYGCDNVIGSVVPDTASIAEGRGLATIQLSRAPGVADTVQKIREGVIRNVSVGYWIHKVEKTEADDGTVARWDVVDWEPLEISAVPIPADPGSQIRSAEKKDGQGPATRSCVVVTKQAPADAPVSNKGAKETSMATRNTTRTVAPKTPKKAEKRLAALEDENKRLRAAARDAKSDDEDADDERDEDTADEVKDDKSDDQRDASAKDDDKSDDEDADDERDGDAESDEEDDGEDEDEQRSGKGKRGLTEAEVRKAAAEAVRADRIRGAEIRKIGGMFGLPKLAEKHANGETSVRAFKDVVLERLAERQKKHGRTFAAAATPEVSDETRVADVGATAHGRAFDKGAAEAKALLGKL